MPKPASSASGSFTGEPADERVGIRPPSQERPVDLVHLARQTFGDRALEREILELFDRQLALLGARMSAAAGEEARLIAHALCGAARNVGAFALADAARALETGTGVQPACRSRLMSELQRARTFIQPLLHGEGGGT